MVHWCIAPNSQGNGIIAAHLDGSIYIFSFEYSDRQAHCIIRHSCVPFALAWGSNIVAAGNNGQVVFYDEDGGEEQSFDMLSPTDNKFDADCREFTVAASNPTGDTIVLGNFNSLYVFCRSKDSMAGWENKYSKKRRCATISEGKPDQPNARKTANILEIV